MSFLEEFTFCHAQCVRWSEEEEDKELPALLPVLRQGALQGTVRLLQGPYNSS